MTDQVQLEDALSWQLRALTDGLAPARDLTERVIIRRRKRRRRAQLTSATVLVASAGAATALATGAGPTRSLSRGPQPPSVALGGQAHDTAYIIKRVTAKVAADSGIGTLIHTYSYGSGDIRPDGSIVNLKYEVGNAWDYIARDRAVYWRYTLYDDASGRPRYDEIDDWVPGANGKDTNTRILINLSQKTYSKSVFKDQSAPNEGPTPNLLSSASQIRRTLRTGLVNVKGTATINGTPVIALAVKPPKGELAPNETLTLYVDARSYQPLRTLFVYDGHLNLEINDCVSPTPARVAMAEDHSIPAGYRQVAKAY